MLQFRHYSVIIWCNCNWGTCIAPPTRRPRAHHRVNPYLGDLWSYNCDHI